MQREWPHSGLDATTDLNAWRTGVQLYEGDADDDYLTMMRCVTLLSPALAHHLYGEGLLRGNELPETVFKVLYASIARPPDGQTFTDNTQKCARLALTIARENGWQPASMGGRGLFDPIIMDKGNYMLFSLAIGPPGSPWPGKMADFFAVPPQRFVAPVVDSRSSIVDTIMTLEEQAQAGDEASELHLQALGLWNEGDLASALETMEQAARLGDAQAMKDAGDLATATGQDAQARFWFESAARAGNGPAMCSMGAIAMRLGDAETASRWWEKAGEAREPDGYSALTQLAQQRGDRVAERHWARLGAEAGQEFCILRHGGHLAADADGDATVLRRAASFIEVMAERGDLDGMLMAGIVNSQLGDQQRATMWFDRVRATGDPEALERLKKYGK